MGFFWVELFYCVYDVGEGFKMFFEVFGIVDYCCVGVGFG